MRTILYALFGYISGSVLYAKNFMKLFNKEELIEESKDKNPGTANAFMYGGMTCGIMTLICELLKGIVYKWSNTTGNRNNSASNCFNYACCWPCVFYV